MKSTLLLLLLTIISIAFVSQNLFAAENPMEGIEIAGIKSIQIFKNSKNENYLEIQALIRNSSGGKVKFKENNFDLYLGKRNDKSEKTLKRVGKARPNEKIFSNMVDKNQVESWKLVVNLGSNEGIVLSTLTEILNIIGNPDNVVQIGIKGKTKAWRQVNNGWVSPGLLEVDLGYSPKLQKEVLFE